MAHTSVTATFFWAHHGELITASSSRQAHHGIFPRTHPTPHTHMYVCTNAQETEPFEDSSNWQLDLNFSGASRGGGGEGGGGGIQEDGAGGGADEAWQRPAERYASVLRLCCVCVELLPGHLARSAARRPGTGSPCAAAVQIISHGVMLLSEVHSSTGPLNRNLKSDPG